ncbi:UDP-N-acetylmuramate dehydrogenase [Desulfovibrio sp. TomC]|uniref:UDP-N-acetylmuramate dehydrogenase n=1 Tax=Desulfovibrio sp. TomC TaxID=1562888 RepID=UPI0005759755|nr:UDP-N-acetylmuramate dehydrogenase [Desulfovibrio sp. TomC]KHK03431.1 UDP-N-acetylenolpyruvoylglucosamine reductase [Desulfovibrio sp. TomC]
MALEIRPGPSLASRTTLKLGGSSLAEVVLTTPEDAEGLSGALEKLGGQPLILGGGSNILARDGDLPLVLVRPQLRAEPAILRERPAGKIRVRVGAGVKLQRLVAWLATQGLSGLAGLVGVPGMVGGAVAGNAGSYGDETGRRLARVRFWTPGRGLVWVGREDLDIGYRRLTLRGEAGLFLVVEAEFDCEVDEPIAIRQEMIANLKKKRASQPITAATAGCVFKNPPGKAAWKLLAEAGFAGKRLGNMEFSGLHANFLVNLGGGTSDEALTLVESAQGAVRELCGHELELEVKVVP